MTSTLETIRYHTARRHLLAGHSEWALVIAGELLRSVSGRDLGFSLLAEMYPEAPKSRAALAISASRGLGGDRIQTADEQGS